jgi:hypothetical protein
MLFDLNSIIFSLMRPFIYSELANRGDAFNYGGIDILPNIGMMFMLEAGYQVSYQI